MSFDFFFDVFQVSYDIDFIVSSLSISRTVSIFRGCLLRILLIIFLGLSCNWQKRFSICELIFLSFSFLMILVAMSDSSFQVSCIDLRHLYISSLSFMFSLKSKEGISI